MSLFYLKFFRFEFFLCSSIQTLLQSATEKAASTKNVQILGLRRALQRAEVSGPALDD